MTKNNEKRMKKMILTVVVALMTTLSVNAQNSELRHEIGVSYGSGVSFFEDLFGYELFTAIFDQAGGYEWRNGSYSGTVGVEYFYHTNDPKLAIGGIGTFTRFSEDVYNKNTDQQTGERKRTYLSLMPAVKYLWVNKEHIGVYSKLGIGAMFVHVKDEDNQRNRSANDDVVHLMMQVSLIGIEFGGKLRGFAELGGGEQGIVLAGLKYKF